MRGQLDVRIDTFSSVIALVIALAAALLNLLPFPAPFAAWMLRAIRALDHSGPSLRHLPAYSRNSSSPSRSAVISAIHNDSPAMRSASRDKIAHLTRLRLIDGRGEGRGARGEGRGASNGGGCREWRDARPRASSYRGSGSATYTRRGPFSQQFICSRSFHLAASRIRVTTRSRPVFFSPADLPRGIISRNVAWQYPCRIICV